MLLEQTNRDVMKETAYLTDTSLPLTVTEALAEDTDEVLEFLSERPIHTICMTGLIRDNGIVSELNRGTFYLCRNSQGFLEGVALIGHATFLETSTREAIRELALVAQIHTNTHMIMGEQEKVEDFWNQYAGDGQPMRLACRELLFELRNFPQSPNQVEGLRPATLEDLKLTAPVHAGMAEAESGVNPLERDREGFLKRCARRIEKNRTWVLIKDNRLIFKADIQAETSDAIYLEGIYVNPLERGTGLGRRCLTQICQNLLTRTQSICVLVNEENEKAQTFYKLCGFSLISRYDTIFLQNNSGQDRVN